MRLSKQSGSANSNAVLTCPDFNKLQQLLLNSDSLSPEEIKQIQHHLHDCSSCRDEWQDLLTIALLRNVPPSSTAPNIAFPEGNLPDHVHLVVGRETEIKDIRQRLFEDGIVQIVGPQGIGKTSVALGAALRSGKRFSDGVWWIDLRGFDSKIGIRTVAEREDLVAEAVATTMRLFPNQSSETAATPPRVREAKLWPFSELVAERLGEQSCLLVLDNVDRVTASAEVLIKRIRARCPFVEILITSQSPLPSLENSTISVGLMTPEDAEKVARISNTNISTPTIWMKSLPEESRGVALIVRLAARLMETDRVMGLELLRQRMGQTLPSVNERINADVYATVDLLYGESLGESQRRILHVLSLFPGGCPSDALTFILKRDSSLLEALPYLPELERQKLVYIERKEGVLRYRFDEVVREYLNNQAKLQPEINLWMESIVLFFIRLAGHKQHNAERINTIARLQDEMINLDLASDWCQNDPMNAELGLDFANALVPYWEKDGNIHKATQIIDFFIEQSVNIEENNNVA